MAGVDLLERGDGRFCVCEVNAAAGIEVCFFKQKKLILFQFNMFEIINFKKAFEHATGKDVALSLIELCARKFNESKN